MVLRPDLISVLPLLDVYLVDDFFSSLVGMECSGKVTPHSIVSPEKAWYKVGESVTVRCVTGYVFIDVSTESEMKLSDLKHLFVNVTRNLSFTQKLFYLWKNDTSNVFHKSSFLFSPVKLTREENVAWNVAKKTQSVKS